MPLHVNPSPPIFALLLLQHRTRIGLDQEPLAKLLPLGDEAGRVTISRWERAESAPRKNNFDALVRVLNLTKDEEAIFQKAVVDARQQIDCREKHLEATDQELFRVLGIFSTLDFSTAVVETLIMAYEDPAPIPFIHRLLARRVLEIVPPTQLPAGTGQRVRFTSPALAECSIYFWRLWSLERQDGRLRRDESATYDRVVNAFVNYYTDLAPTTEAHLLLPTDANLTSAYDWAVGNGDQIRVLRLANGICKLARDRGDYQQANAVLQTLGALIRAQLNQRTSREDALRAAELLSLRGQLEHHVGHLTQAEMTLTDARHQFRSRGDEANEATTLSHRARLYLDLGKFPEAEDDIREALRLHRNLKKRREEGVDISTQGWIALMQGNPDRAGELFEQSLQIRIAEGHQHRGEAIDRRCLAQLALWRDDPDEAEYQLTQSLAISQSPYINGKLDEIRTTAVLGQVAEKRGEYVTAYDRFMVAWTLARDLYDAGAICYLLWLRAHLGAYRKDGKGDVAKAVTNYREALHRSQSMGYKPYYAAICDDYARFVNVDHGWYDPEASAYEQDAATFYRDLALKPGFTPFL